MNLENAIIELRKTDISELRLMQVKLEGCRWSVVRGR